MTSLKFFQQCFLSIIVLVFTSNVSAEWVSVTGKAKVINKNYDAAQESARQDAIQQALDLFGARVSSFQKVENGVLKTDSLSVASDLKVKNALVEDQFEKNGFLHLAMRINVEDVPVCPESQASRYKKKIAMMGFSVEAPRQQGAGDFDNIERGLASALNKRLSANDTVLVYENSQTSLYTDVMNAPSGFTSQNTLTKVAHVAKELGVQFVVSGVIRDMSFEDPDAHSTSFLARFLRLGGYTNTQRRFALELFVHDGFSGAIIWQRNFALSAPWELDKGSSVGFASGQFWQLEYGKAVGELLDGISMLIGEQLACQPFITRISRIEGKTLHFDSGASSGVRPGDKLSLYRTFNYVDSDLLKGTELTNVKTALTVAQVHPGFATGTVAVDPGRINIQEDDVLIAW